MFNFYVVSAGHDILGLACAGENSKPHDYKQKYIFPVNKKFWPIFFCIIEHDICQGTIYKGPPGLLTKFMQLIRSFRWDLKVSKKQTFQKIAVFTVTKLCGPFFLILSRVTLLKEQYLRVHKVFRQLLWKS